MPASNNKDQSAYESLQQEPQQLYPIRIDVSDAAQQLRLVDTLLVDADLPIDANSMAYSVISDAQVLGMVRSSQHFSGRLNYRMDGDLWKKVAQQITDQVETMKQLESKRKLHLVLRRAEERANKKQKTEAKAPAPAAPTTMAQKLAALYKESANTTVASTTTTKLIPIRLRLSVHGIRIHDDFDWDPYGPMGPLQMAESIGKDLLLPAEAVQAVAIAIAEQASGGVVVTDPASMNSSQEGGPSTLTSKTTAAWELPAQAKTTHVAHLVAHHRPTA